MKRLIYLFTFILTVAFSGSVSAQDIIKAKELAKISNNKDVIIVSGRSPADYKKRHITNSVNLNHKDLYSDSGVENMLKPTDDIAQILGSKGITNEKTIIIYDEGSGKYACRLYWILDYMGAENVKILDGQMKAWSMTRIPFTDLVPTVQVGTFTAKVDKSKLATIAQVKDAQKDANTVILDVRTIAEYNGESETELRKGHIPGAKNIPYENVLTNRSKLKSKENLANLFNAEGVTADKEIIIYCGSGIRASIVYFALKSVLAYPKVKVYDGAYLEWQSDSANPVE